MTTRTVKGLDLSFAQPPQSWWRARRTDGYCVMVQNLWTGTTTPRAARPNLANARAVGMIVAGYAVVNDRPGTDTVKLARAIADIHWRHLRRLFIDAEEDPNTHLPLSDYATVIDAVQATKDASMPPGVYSRASYWHSAFGDVPTNAPIWTAERNSGPQLATIRYPWGGQKIIGKQYTGTTNLDGHAVDLNTFDAAAFGITIEEEEDDMLDILKDAATFKFMHNAAHRKPAPRTRYDTIRAGGNCTFLAKRNGITLARLRKLNPGKVKNLVHKGDSFRVA